MNVLGKGNLVAAIDEAITVAGQSDEYFRGMCNGMIYVKSLIDGKKPEYFEDVQNDGNSG